MFEEMKPDDDINVGHLHLTLVMSDISKVAYEPMKNYYFQYEKNMGHIHKLTKYTGGETGYKQLLVKFLRQMADEIEQQM